jgi:hypothetical protein
LLQCSSSLHFFRFQHALSPNFVTSIDSSPREQRTRFHPVSPFTNIMMEGGSTCLVLGSVNCAIPITPNSAICVTKGTHMICKSWGDFVLWAETDKFYPPPPGCSEDSKVELRKVKCVWAYLFTVDLQSKAIEIGDCRALALHV